VSNPEENAISLATCHAVVTHETFNPPLSDELPHKDYIVFLLLKKKCIFINI
jgi:hypothetical protein